MVNAKPSSAERVIRWASTASVIALAGIAAVISYKRMYQLVSPAIRSRLLQSGRPDTRPFPGFPWGNGLVR
ncbi:hypothetical protein GCM10010411_92220 [Actinomadura fulvescens]|uniref:Uncharacterized protein n=1 Tax=Actinomadura fulvescens TaxID=46160 RepID=A0ABN3QXK3_9ACTN